ncbi:uncharacterized protein P884DRAFT_237472 [Thermothelomyces heterothallicus CBS 202.75]|uniref:uncharacterized protein n=1 Tax=Thermothelomyces heterothallicus CBS 202.75 TaxID=1149848 RepID=UPI003744602B
MGVPVVLATMAACGSLVTSLKSSLELRRMLQREKEGRECEEVAPRVFRRLRRAYCDGLMSTAEYELWYEKFLMAKVEKDLSGMRRIRAHLRILESGAPVAPNERSKKIEQRSRRSSVSYGAAQPYTDIPQSRASLKYTPHPRANIGAPPDQFIPLDQQPTYSRACSSDASARRRDRSTARQQSRGRTGVRYDGDDSGDDYDSSDGRGRTEYYSEKRHHRGRSLPRY